MREFLKTLELDKEVIDKIMAEHGKSITDLKDKLQTSESQVKDYETKINDLKSKAGDNEKIQNELDTLKKTIEENERLAKAKAEDEVLTKNINDAFGDKKFVNEYTKTAIINDIKSALKDTNNVGKSAKDLFEELTKDKDGIFENPNKGISTPPTGDVDTEIVKENHARELLGLEIKEK